MRPEVEALSRAVLAGTRIAGQIHGWVDGDTVDVLARDPIIGLPVVIRARVMVDGRESVNAPDRRQAGYAEVKAAVAEEFPPGRLVLLILFGADKYAGRVDAAVQAADDGTSVAGWLLDRGYAVPWDGRGERPVVSWPPPPR